MTRSRTGATQPPWQLSSRAGDESTVGSGSQDFAASTDGSGSIDGSGPSTPAAENEDDIVFPTPTTEECRYISHDTATNCSTYRPCDSCLRKEGCRVGIDGFCELDDSSTIYDYRLAFDSNLALPAALNINASALAANQTWIFRASDAIYCPTDDTVCQRCIKKSFWLTDSSDSRFCVGNTEINASRGLCVCISNCANSNNATYCSPSATPEVMTAKDDWWRLGWVMMIVVILVALLLCILLWVGCCCIRRRRAERREEAQLLEAQMALQDATPAAVQGPGYFEKATPAVPATEYFEEESGRSVEL